MTAPTLYRAGQATREAQATRRCKQKCRAEIYANFETAVRAAAEADRGAIFDASNQQMERLDNSAKRQLRGLRKSLKPEASVVRIAPGRKPAISKIN